MPAKAAAPTVANRYDFVLLFDVTNGNPNGDPDAGNAPRVDPDTGHGLVSDVCLKRKIRNYVTLARRTEDGSPMVGYDIYVKERAVLNHQHQRAYDAIGVKPNGEKKKGTPAPQDQARQWMCQTFFDIRMFGAVMTTTVDAGQVRGPVQLTFARSIEPIVSLEQAITRMAVTTEKESESQSGGNRTMGRKEIVPYALYECHGFVSPFLARDTGFNEDDLQVLKEALAGMFEVDRSAARGEMCLRNCFAFRHESALGNARAHRLFERFSVRRKAAENAAPARRFDDYEVILDDKNLPAGVTVEEWV